VARVARVLNATALALWRQRESLLSVTTNNFFLAIGFFFLFGIFVHYTVGIIFYLLLGTVLLFPLSADPIQKIPFERLAVWPLRRTEHFLLRMSAPWLNPITWLLAIVIVWSALGRKPEAAGISAVALVLVPFLGTAVPQRGRSRIWLLVPRMPGLLGELIRKDLRQLLATLDVWLAAVLASIFLLYRLFAHEVSTEAQTIFALLIVVALSTASQTLFALDGPQGIVRYHVLPVRGWQVLAAKAASWLGLVLLLTAPVSLLVGISAALGALPFGFWTSVNHRSSQRRWRFTASPTPWVGIASVVATLCTGVAVYRISLLWAIPAVVAGLVSLGFSGWRFDRNALSS
jgi:hypothetical protein